MVGLFLSWHINLCGLFNAKAILVEEHVYYYLTHTVKDEGGYAFLKSIS